ASRKRSLRCPERAGPAARALLQPYRAFVDRSGVDGAHAAHRLQLWHSFGTAAVRRGPPESGLSLVLPFGTRGCGAGPLDVLKEPPWALSGERRISAAL